MRPKYNIGSKQVKVIEKMKDNICKIKEQNC